MLLKMTAGVVSVAAAVALLTAPVGAQTPKRGGNLIIGGELEPPSYDCHAAAGGNTINYTAAHYSLLVRYDQQNYPKIIGDLADSWTVSPDGLTYTFKLRPNVKFHDGSTLTAEDVKATYERIRNPPTGVVSVRKPDYSDIVSVDTPDPLTVVFKLGQRNAAMLDLFASPYNCVYSAKRLAENQAYPATNVMGTGAFTFVEYVKGQSWSGKRFDGYFRQGLPYLDSYKWQLFSPGGEYPALVAGQIDAVVRGNAPAETQMLNANFAGKVKFPANDLLIVDLVTFNVNRKPFDDVRVRKALTLAIDRWGGLEPMTKITNIRSVTGMLRTGYDMALTQAELEKMPGFGRDINAARVEARRLLAEAGQSNLSFKLNNSTQTNPFGTLGVFLINEWRQIGVNVEQSANDFSTFLRINTTGEFDVTVDYATVASDDPVISLVKWVPGTGSNYGKISDPMLTDLYNRQKVSGDLAERTTLVKQFQTRVLEQAYSAPLFRPGWIFSVTNKVQNWAPTSNYFVGYDLTEVWIQ